MNNIYYGKETQRAIRNFPFSKNPVPKELIYAIVEIKKAAAIANFNVGDLEKGNKDAIVETCDEILTSKYDNQFITPGLQGGAGTSINMNVNEVIAARASEILKEKGKLLQIHPLDHVNRSQSTNDVNPSALKIACIRLTQKLLKDLKEIVLVSFEKKASEFKDIPKLGRTHLQDAVPTTLGAEFQAYYEILKRDRKRIEGILEYFYDLNLGGTAIGNSINASVSYIKAIYKELSLLTGYSLKPAKDLMSQTSSQTDFCMLSQSLVLLTLDMSKISSDIRLIGSGPKGGLGEIKIRELQAGSSIMPGKVNPILPESVNQLYFLVSGHNLTIEHSAHASQLELGVMFPILADRIVLSLKLTREILTNFSLQCVNYIEADPIQCREHLEKSTAYATLLTPILGYDKVSNIVKESLKTGRTLRDLVVSKKIMTEGEFDKAIKIINT